MSYMSELDLMYRDILREIKRYDMSFSEAMTRLFGLYPDITDVEIEYLRPMIKAAANKGENENV